MMTWQFYKNHERNITMYYVLCLVISMSSLVVSISSSISIETHRNQLWHRGIKQFMEKYLEATKPQSPLNFIMDRQVNSIFTEDILNAYRTSYPLILRDSKDRIAPCNTPSCYKMQSIVGVFKTAENVIVNQWKNFYNEAWDPSAPIAIWISDRTNVDDIEKLLKSFWQHDSIDVIVIIIDVIKNTTIVYSYNPFVIKSDRDRGEVFQIAPGDTLYPDKLKNLHGYSIPISLYENQPHATLNNFTELTDGSDVNYCKTLSQWMNFTISLKSAPVDYSSYIVTLHNGSEYNAVGDIITNRSIMIGNSMHWELNDWLEVDNAYPRWRSKIVVIVPRDKLLPGVSHLFKSGSGITMALISGALCLLFIIQCFKGDDNALLTTLSLMLHQTFRKISRQNSERLFCIAWIYWSLVLISSFQGKLVHDIAAPPYHSDMNTLRALYKSNLTLMTKMWEHKLLNNSYTDSMRRLSQKSIIEMNSTKCTIKMIKYKNVACTVEGAHADYTIGQVRRAIYKMRQLNKKAFIVRDIHIIKEPLFYYWRTYIVKKNFVYLKKINKLATRLMEFGIMKKWRRDDLAKNLQMRFTVNNREPLDLKQTQNVFILLIYGYIVAAFVFSIEIIYYKLKHKNNTKKAM